MEHELVLKAAKRQVVGKAVRHLRKQGTLPIILYGRDTEPKVLSVPVKSFRQIFREAGQSSLIDVQVDKEKPAKVLIHHVQFDPVTDEILHADLYQVKMTEKVRTEVPLTFTGESPAVKELEGNLITQKDRLTIEALPADLPPEIEVDISPLQTFEDVIKVSSIKATLPSTIHVLDADEEVVALVTPPRSEEELTALEAPTVAEEEQVAALEQKLEEEKVAKEAEKAAEEGPEASAQAPAKEETKE
jgi:large subunit ribosomal protein L25